MMTLPDWVTKYWLEWAFGLLIAGLTAVVRSMSVRIKKQQQENQALRDGIRALLKVSIENECQRCQRDGWCGPVKRSTIADMYRSYTALDGNDGMKSLVEQTLALPSVDPDEMRRNGA